ncbi:MAG: hypothetical protein K0U64_12610 [Actinomycetia bacterium]|nr:hypothetical protein [Actinomycetes bacterium]
MYPTLGEADCERITTGLLAQPINAASSLSYLLVATGLLLWGARTRRLSVGLLWYSALLALVGIGSVDYHGFGSPIAQWLHDIPILALLALAVLTPIVRWRRAEPVCPGAGAGLLTLIGAGFTVGLVTFALGGTGSPWCQPDDLVQYHAFWHMITAASLGGWAVALFGGAAESDRRAD